MYYKHLDGVLFAHQTRRAWVAREQTKFVFHRFMRVRKPISYKI